jgi:hypothetical protein
MTRRLEDQIQRAVVNHLTVRGVPGLVFFHVPNGGRRGKIEGAIFKSLGVKPGVSDLILLHKGRFFALEIKTPKGSPTATQKQFIENVKAAGGTATWVNGINEALCVLSIWGLLRPIEGLSKVAA